MAILRSKKEQLVSEYVSLLSASQVTIWADYSGLKVSELSQLRNRIRKQGARIHIIKNTLLKRALEECDLPLPAEHLIGPTAVVFLSDRIAGAAKEVADYAAANRQFEIKCGLTRTSVFTTAQVRELAYLPSREVLLARVLGGLQAPVSSIWQRSGDPIGEPPQH